MMVQMPGSVPSAHMPARPHEGILSQKQGPQFTMWPMIRAHPPPALGPRCSPLAWCRHEGC